jgi:hypothetical protein
MRTRASSDEIRNVLDSEKSAHLKMLDQPRVRHATVSASPTPSPEGKQKKQKKQKKHKKKKYEV